MKTDRDEQSLKVWPPQFDGEPIAIKLKGLKRRRLVAWDEFGQSWMFDPDYRIWRAL